MPISQTELEAVLKVAGLEPPVECLAGIMTNLALLARHSAIFRRIDDPREDVAELIAP